MLLPPPLARKALGCKTRDNLFDAWSHPVRCQSLHPRQRGIFRPPVETPERDRVTRRSPNDAAMMVLSAPSAPATANALRPTCSRLIRMTATFVFGYAANDEQVRRYVSGLDFERDEIFGIYNRPP